MYRSLAFLCAAVLTLAVACGDDGGGNDVNNNNDIGNNNNDVGNNNNDVTVTVTGCVEDPDGDISGATVKVYQASATATTDGTGNFALDGVTPGEVWFDVAAADHWGVLEMRVVLANGALEDTACFESVKDADVTDVVTALSETEDHAKGIVAVGFDNHVGGEGATLSQPSDFSFTFDNLGDPVAGTALLANGDGELIFGNVTVGTTTVTLNNAPGCTLESVETANFPVVADYVTEIGVVCQ
jgi:hypothetical protein